MTVAFNHEDKIIGFSRKMGEMSSKEHPSQFFYFEITWIFSVGDSENLDS